MAESFRQRAGAKLDEIVRAHFPDAEGYIWNSVTIGKQTIGTRGDRFRFKDPAWVNAIHPNQPYVVIQGTNTDGTLDFGIPQMGEIGVKGFLGHKEDPNIRHVGNQGWQ